MDKPKRIDLNEPTMLFSDVSIKPIRSFIDGKMVNPDPNSLVETKTGKDHDTLTVHPNFGSMPNGFDELDESPFVDQIKEKKGRKEKGTISIPENQFVPIFHYYIEKGFSGKTLLLYAFVCSMVCLSDNHVFRCGKDRIASWIGGSQSDANRLLNNLKKEGHIVWTGETGRGGVKEYILPENEYAIIQKLFDEAYIKKVVYYRKKRKKT